MTESEPTSRRTNKVRFPTAVPSGRRIRLVSKVTEVQPIPGGVQVLYQATVELEGTDRPALVADLLYRYYPEPSVA